MSSKRNQKHDPTTKHGIVEMLDARTSGCVAWRGRSCVCVRVCVWEGQPDRMIDLHWLWFP